MKFFPILYGFFVFVMALTLASSPRSGTEVLTVDRLDLSLSPGDRPILVFRSEEPVDVAVFRQRDFERGRPPAISLPQVLEARLAMPSDVYETYVIVASRSVNVEIPPSKIEETNPDDSPG